MARSKSRPKVVLQPGVNGLIACGSEQWLNVIHFGLTTILRVLTSVLRFGHNNYILSSGVPTCRLPDSPSDTSTGLQDCLGLLIGSSHKHQSPLSNQVNIIRGFRPLFGEGLRLFLSLTITQRNTSPSINIHHVLFIRMR